MNNKKSSLERFRLKRTVETLASKEGRGTELVSLYIPPGRQVSEVLAMLKQENGTASNIKSDITRKNVQDAITKVSQRLRLFKKIPKNGLVFFCGAIPQNGGPGSERIETYVINPPEPVHVYLYRCDSRFHTEYLTEFLKEKEVFGIIAIDSSEATIATLEGNRLEKVREITSGIPGKHRAGGQSAARFQRLREAKVLEFYKRVGKHANEIFLQIQDLKGIIIGGPGPTKQDFEKGGSLQYTLRDKIIATLDTAYVGEQGLKEIMEKAPSILEHVRYVEEKRIMQKFLYEIGNDTGLATYGEAEVRRALKVGAVKTLLLSEDLDLVQIDIRCSNCDNFYHKIVKVKNASRTEQTTKEQACLKCSAQSLKIEEKKDLVDELAELAERVGSDIEVLSTKIEEGMMLKDSFGGVAAILRFKPTNN